MLVVWYSSGQGDHLSSDSHQHYRIAQSIVSGEGFQLDGIPTSRRGPVYPHFIALFLKWGGFPIGLQITQAILGALSCVLLFLIGRILFGEWPGILAALILCVDYLSIKQVVYVLPEVLFVFLLLLSMLFLFKVQKEGRILWALLAGVFAGGAVLTKEVASLYFPLVIFSVFLVRGLWKAKALRVFVFLFGFALFVFPWVARNRLVHQEWVFLTINTGHIVYLGNNPQTNVRIMGGGWDHGVDSDFPKNDPDLPPLLTIEADRYLMKKGLNYMGGHPIRFLELTGKKVLKLWFPYYSDSPFLVKGITILSYIFVMLFGIVGVILSRKRWRELFPLYLLIIYITSIHSVTIASIRYRFPMMPFLMLFAAYGLCELWHRYEPFQARMAFISREETIR